jgi:hypothetical protein
MLIRGAADPITSADGSQTFFRNVRLADKTLKLHEGGYHQAFININWKQVPADVKNWLDRLVKEGKKISLGPQKRVMRRPGIALSFGKPVPCQNTPARSLIRNY